MITKAEILTIDYEGNTCTIRMPLFENANGGEKAISTAIISNTPGIYNGYKEGDVVLVAFENGQLQNPCVIGKLYLGSAIENKEARGSINCSTLVSESANTLPLSTKIESDLQNDVKISEGITTYKTLQDVINKLTYLSNVASQNTLTIEEQLKTIKGYDKTKIQILKNSNGTIE